MNMDSELSSAAIFIVYIPASQCLDTKQDDVFYRWNPIGSEFFPVKKIIV